MYLISRRSSGWRAVVATSSWTCWASLSLFAVPTILSINSVFAALQRHDRLVQAFLACRRDRLLHQVPVDPVVQLDQCRSCSIRAPPGAFLFLF
uniref:Secreted protein n=1 Tax=Parascaris univalens TaxID=6257 RepID=A0A915BU27_PARUN